MQENGLGPRQVTQVRGYADQQLHQPESPEDASNRRISIIVHYLVKPDVDEENRPDKAANQASALTSGQRH
jgi:chemotaxis protein MotB